MFLEVEIVHLRVVSHKDIYKAEEELVSIRLNINIPCEIPEDKYKMLYCFNCNKIIYSDCSKNEHEGHQIEEKADYLAPAQLLMNRIFSNSSKYKADTRLSKYLWCIDDEIFLTLYNKLKEIEQYKNICLEENELKYEKLNNSLEPFINQIQEMIDNLSNIFGAFLGSDIYEKFKNLISENVVEKIQKKEVNDLMFGNIGVLRRPENKNQQLDNDIFKNIVKNIIIIIYLKKKL